jgi:hypothetical protein
MADEKRPLPTFRAHHNGVRKVRFALGEGVSSEALGALRARCSEAGVASQVEPFGERLLAANIFATADVDSLADRKFSDRLAWLAEELAPQQAELLDVGPFHELDDGSGFFVGTVGEQATLMEPPVEQQAPQFTPRGLTFAEQRRAEKRKRNEFGGLAINAPFESIHKANEGMSPQKKMMRAASLAREAVAYFADNQEDITWGPGEDVSMGEDAFETDSEFLELEDMDDPMWKALEKVYAETFAAGIKAIRLKRKK